TLKYQLLPYHADGACCITANLDHQCPLWVKSRHSRISARCPLYPQKRTSVERVEMSAKCQKKEVSSRGSRRCIALKFRRLVVPTGTIPFVLKGCDVRAVGHTPILRYCFSCLEFDRLISLLSKKCLTFGNGLRCEIA